MIALLDIRALCCKIGGSRPVDPSTVYRKISGILPKPIKLGRIARWREAEIDPVLRDLDSARANPQS